MNKRMFLGISFTIILIGVLVMIGYLNFIPSGIIFKNGIHQSDVKVIYQGGEWFRYYLYDDNENKKGIIALRKRDRSLLWSEYYKTEVSKNKNEVELFQSFYPTFEEGFINSKRIYGCIIPSKLNDNQELVIHINDDIKKEILFKKEASKSYFMFEDVNDLNSDNYELRVD